MARAIGAIVTCVFCTLGGAWGQQNTPLQGACTPNVLAKFTSKDTVGNTAIVESGGHILTSDKVTVTINAAPGIALQSTNNTTEGSTAQDAALTSGIRGFVAGTSSPSGVGVSVVSNATDGDPIGVLAINHSTYRGIAVRGISATPSGAGIGVLGVGNSPEGFGVMGVNQASSGYGTGIFGYVLSPDGGIGVLGRAWSTTGFGIGVRGEALTPDGTAGLFDSQAGGNILVGVSLGSEKFRVDGTGAVYASSYNIGGADLAESILVKGKRAEYSPGDLLVIDPTANRRLAVASQPYSRLVAGIYSTQPGLLASTRKVSEPTPLNEVPLAVVGIVPCKASAENGAIKVGDLLVTSSTAGYAMKGTERKRMLGAVVGKALEPLKNGKGKIQVLVTLQ